MLYIAVQSFYKDNMVTLHLNRHSIHFKFYEDVGTIWPFMFFLYNLTRAGVLR